MSLFAPLPDKKYDIIYAYPPWHYSGIHTKKAASLTKSAYKHYPTVKLKDLMKLPVSSISRPDCLLYLWATGPCLQEAMELGVSWGFEYKQIAFVWHKQNQVMGSYSLTSCELVLVFKRGRIPAKTTVKGIEQFISIRAFKHSAKPLAIRLRIDKMFPNLNKIELFARKPEDGLIPYPRYALWDTWGNEV